MKKIIFVNSISMKNLIALENAGYKVFMVQKRCQLNREVINVW